jgi:tetraether lipid synthase
VLPGELERRTTFPDIIRRIAEDCPQVWQESDFTPLPCAHPNAHTLAYAYRGGGAVVPLARFIDLARHIDLLSGGITFNRARARELVSELISRQCCSSGGCGCNPPAGADSFVELTQLNGGPATNVQQLPVTKRWTSIADEFFRRVLAEDISPADVFRITTTSFMDAYNFDVRQAMKDCVHFVLPTGHIIPFSVYNLLYRPGLVPLPTLRKEYHRGATDNTDKNEQCRIRNAK